jgi:hypothetical protein
VDAVSVRSSLERALRVRGYNDGRAGRDYAFPDNLLYVASYANGQLARQRENGGQPEQGANPDADGAPPARPRSAA